MNYARNFSRAVGKSLYAANDARINFLNKRKLPLSIAWDEEDAVIDAYVTSAQAARLLAPLGPDAIGTFRLMPGNMVAVEAIVSHHKAAEMLAAFKAE